MSKNTALSAEKEKQIIFAEKNHEYFFYQALTKADNFDVYHQALFYCLGIDKDTRRHICEIYNFEDGTVNPDCLNSGWITSGSARVVRMAFNLFCNSSPSVDEEAKHEEQLREYERYTPEDLFCCGYAKYFWQAVKLRYPEYCE